MGYIGIKPSTTVQELIELIKKEFDEFVEINVLTMKGNVAGEDRRLRALTKNDLSGGIKIKVKKNLNETLNNFSQLTGINFSTKVKVGKKETTKGKKNAEHPNSNYINIKVEGGGFQVYLYDIENAGVKFDTPGWQDSIKFDTEFWWNDNWQLDAKDKSVELINYTLPEYNSNNRIIIEYKGKKTTFDIEDFESIYNLDKIYSPEIWSKYLKPNAPKSGEKILLFSFSTDGTYDFKKLDIGNEEFDPEKLKINRLRSIACLEDDLIESFVYNNNISKSDINSFEQTPYEPELMSMADLEDPKYQDNFQKQEIYDLYMPLYNIAMWKNDPKTFNVEEIFENSPGELGDLIIHSRCPKDLLEHINNFLMSKKKLDKNWKPVLEYLKKLLNK